MLGPLAGPGATLRIVRFELYSCSLPMRQVVEHRAVRRAAAQVLLLKATDASGEAGWGECCPKRALTGETEGGAARALAEELLPPWLGRELDGLDELVHILEGSLDEVRRDRQSARCALELALLDLGGRLEGRAAADWLGPAALERVRYSAVIAATSVAGVTAWAQSLAPAAPREAKVKLGPDLGENRAALAAARAVLGEGVELRADANGAWSADEALRQLEALAEFRLAGIEQPVSPADVDGMARLTRAGLVRVIADESLCTLADARRFADARACDLFNLRLSKNGGLLALRRLRGIAAAAGIGCQLGAGVGETGILSAAGRQIALRWPELRWREGSAGLLAVEPCVPDPAAGPRGEAAALPGPGLGVRVVEARLSPAARRLSRLQVWR